MAKTDRQKAIKQADDKLSLYIRKRDRVCVICGRADLLTNGHLITRGKHSTRWDEDNCACQCVGCNLRHEHQPEIFTNWWIKKHGIDAYYALVLKSNIPRKFTIHELRDIGSYYSEKLKEMGE